MEAESYRLGYTPSLDGLRAIAIVLVFVFHVPDTFFYLPTGWIGVDLFFVLSGFLITTLLVREHHTQSSIDLRNFYVRRFLRLLPALVVTLIGVNIIGLTLDSVERGEIANSSVAVATYASNWFSAFGSLPHPMLEYTWSLAIEEQYYLVWALVVAVFLARGGSPERLMRVALAVAAASVAWRVVLLVAFDATYERVYFATDTRLDGILLGSALGCAVHTDLLARTRTYVESVWNQRLATAAFIVLIAVSRFPGRGNLVEFAIVLPAVNVLAAYLTISLVLAPPRILRVVLEHPAVVRLGRISYGVYLFHIPVIFTIRRFFTPSAEVYFVVTFVVTVLLADLSFRVIESPVLRLKHRFQSDRQVSLRSA